jgi:hypothetical protein
MKIVARPGLVAFALSLASLAACGTSNKDAGGSGAAAGTQAAGTGGTSIAGSGGTEDGGMGGSSGSGDNSDAGTGGTSVVGADGSTPATMNIKAAEGGTVTAEGLTVVIPPGALMADTDVTVAISDGADLPAATTLVAKVYELGPTGTKFLKPVNITIAFDAAKLVAPKVATVAFLEAGAWVPLADSATTGTTALATTTHFTPFGVVSTDPVVVNCTGMPKAACQTCCETAFASGKDKVIPSILKTCGCTAGAPCDTVCESNACMGVAISADCQTCMSAEGSKVNSVCFDQGLIACQTISDCKAYLACGPSCM